MERRIRTLCLMLAAICLAGCVRADQRGEAPRKTRIGVTVYREDDTFIASITERLESLALMRGMTDNTQILLNVMNAQNNQLTQNDQVDMLIGQRYDAICVNIVDRTAAAALVDKAKLAGIPLVFFNREPVEEDMRRWEKCYYVGVDSRQAGALQGRIVARAYRASPETVDKNGDGILQYVMLEGEPGHQDTLIRTESCISTLSGAGIRTEKLASDTANWQRAQGAQRMSGWIGQYGSRIEVVISNNDDMALGAIDALAAAGVAAASFPVIVGVDGTRPARLAMEEGTLAGTVLNDADHLADVIFQLACGLGENKDVSGLLGGGNKIRVPHRILTKAEG